MKMKTIKRATAAVLVGLCLGATLMTFTASSSSVRFYHGSNHPSSDFCGKHDGNGKSHQRCS